MWSFVNNYPEFWTVFLLTQSRWLGLIKFQKQKSNNRSGKEGLGFYAIINNKVLEEYEKETTFSHSMQSFWSSKASKMIFILNTETYIYIFTSCSWTSLMKLLT